MKRIYLCIDLKTFYASVECVERGLDPFKTDLVVADASRGKGTICLAISPKMKERGIHNRCRFYEIPEGINPVVAKPRMKKYIEYSAWIYSGNASARQLSEAEFTRDQKQHDAGRCTRRIPPPCTQIHRTYTS